MLLLLPFTCELQVPSAGQNKQLVKKPLLFSSGSAEQGAHLCFGQHPDEGVVSMENLLPGEGVVCVCTYTCMLVHAHVP